MTEKKICIGTVTNDFSRQKQPRRCGRPATRGDYCGLHEPSRVLQKKKEKEAARKEEERARLMETYETVLSMLSPHLCESCIERATSLLLVTDGLDTPS